LIVTGKIVKITVI